LTFPAGGWTRRKELLRIAAELLQLKPELEAGKYHGQTAIASAAFFRDNPSGVFISKLIDGTGQGSGLWDCTSSRSCKQEVEQIG
jgi:hypothetical protein